MGWLIGHRGRPIGPRGCVLLIGSDALGNVPSNGVGWSESEKLANDDVMMIGRNVMDGGRWRKAVENGRGMEAEFSCFVGEEVDLPIFVWCPFARHC